MNLQIRPISKDAVEEVVQLSLLAWEPVFDSFKEILGSKIFSTLFPDWRAHQRKHIERVCRDDPEAIVWVAEVDGKVVGFIAYYLKTEEETGEVYFLAVHPEYQNQEIGTRLNNFVLEKMKEAGMKLAMVGTGGDASHAPARRSYEKVGYVGLPNVIYYKDLG